MKEQEARNLVEYLRGEGPPLVITGSRGCGKSNLLKMVRESLEKENRLCVEVSAEERPRNSMDEGLAQAAEDGMRDLLLAHQLEHRFLHSRNEAGGPALPVVSLASGTLYLFVDGLDFVISRDSFDASFLPLEIPGSMRLIVAASRGPVVEALAARGWRIHDVQPLETPERRALIRTSMGREDAQEEALLAWQHGGHPQHLRIAASLAKDTGHAPAPDESVSSVCAQLLALRAPRPEHAGFLAVAEYGLPPHALGELLERFTVSCLDPLVGIRRGFFVPTTSEVAEACRAACSEEQLRAAHRRVFEVYSDTEHLSFHREAAEHLLAIEEYALLADHLTRFQVFQILINSSQSFLERCWQNARLCDGQERYERMLAQSLPRIEVETRVALLNNVGLFARKMGWASMAATYLRQAVTEAKNAFPATHGKVGTALINLAERLQNDAANDQEVEGLYREALATVEGPVPVDEAYPKPWLVLRSYANFLEGSRLRREDEGLALRERGIAAARAELGARHPVVGNELLYASRQIRWHSPARALSLAREAHDIMLAATGPSSSSTNFATRQIAAAELVLGHIEQAKQTCERALLVGHALAGRTPLEEGYVLDMLVDLADAEDDRATGLRLRGEQLALYRGAPSFGPGHDKTLSTGWDLRTRYESAGMFDRALEMDAWLSEGYAVRGGPENGDALAVHVARARVLWRTGRRSEGEALLERWSGAIERAASPWTRSLAAVLRAIWSREDGQAVVAREFMERALVNAREAELSPGWGLIYVLSAGQHFLDGDLETSARQYETGAGAVNDEQAYLREMALAPYLPRAGDQAAMAEVRRIRHEELSVRLSLSADRPYLDRRRLPAKALRAAWNPADGRTLAVLDKNGQTYLFVWHAESAHLERVDQPFARRELPKDLAAITLRWSASGSALRFVTPDADQTLGSPAKDEVWVPATTLSPDSRFVAYLGGRSISVNQAQARPSLSERLPNRPAAPP